MSYKIVQLRVTAKIAENPQKCQPYSLAYDELNSIQFQLLIRNAWLKAGYDGSNIEIFNIKMLEIFVLIMLQIFV
jgi:hypothetical protein